MKTVVLESSLRKIVREELTRYINEDKQEQVLEEGRLQQFLRGLTLALGLGSGVAGAKLTSELPATTPTMAVMQSVAGDEELAKELVSKFAYDQNTREITYNKKELGSISTETEELIEEYFRIEDVNEKGKFLEKNKSKFNELQTIINKSPELKAMQKDKALAGMTLLAALVLLIGSSMELVLASEGGPATGLLRGKGSVVRPRAPYGKTG